MVSKRAVGLAVYAIALIVAGVYGYVAMTSAQTIDYSSSLCTAPRGGTTLPLCLPSETISETGSALMFPMFQLWAANFSQRYPNFQINTANTGSGTGQSFVERGLAQIGASGAFLTDTQRAQFPNILDIPLAVTADIIEYNIPELSANIQLNFTAPLLTQIYNSTVQYWDDQKILSINPGAVPFLHGCSQKAKPCVIWPTYRSDAEDDTLYFTQYLSAGDPWWNSTVGSGLQVNWPACNASRSPTGQCVSTPQSSLGNPGIVIATADRTYAMSYVSVEALDQWVLCHPNRPECTWSLGHGLLENSKGRFVDATIQTIDASLSALASRTPIDERLPLVNAPGLNAYPLVGYAYALVNKLQATPQFALVLRTFLTFCMLPDYGNSLTSLNVYHFVPLPANVLQLSLNQTSVIGP